MRGTEPRHSTAFRELFTRSRLPMLLVDDDGRYVAANRAACELLRLPEAEILERSVGGFSPPEVRERVRDAWRRLLDDGTLQGEFELVLPDGSRIDVEASVTAHVEPGCHMAILLPRRGPEPVAEAEGRPPDESRSAPPPGSGPRISPRERQVLRLLALGSSTAGIARDLGISPETVRNHLRSARAKLGAKTRAHAIALALNRDEIEL